MNFYTQKELNDIGFNFLGDNVLVSKQCSIYGAEKISIGSNVRIDDFCILSGQIAIGDYVHISAYSALYGKAGIEIGNFCGISPRSTLYSASDDFSGEHMVSPMVPSQLTNVKTGKILLKDYVQLGANTIVMPAVFINEGAVTGAFSLVLKELKPWTINWGIPCQFYKTRKQNPIQLSKNII